MPSRGPYRWPPLEFALWAVWRTAAPVRRAGPAARRAGRRSVELWGDLRHLTVETAFAVATVLAAVATVVLWWVAR